MWITLNLKQWHTPTLTLCPAHKKFWTQKCTSNVPEVDRNNLRGNICFVHLYDPIIYSPSMEQHFRDLQAVFKKLRAARPSTWRSATFPKLHQVQVAGIQVDPDKTKPVEEFPVLNNNKDVQQFLGLSGWYYQFVPNLSHRVEHLNALKHKGVKFNTWVSVCFWNPEDLSGLSTHFRASKLWLCVCCLTDASDMGLVAVLFRGPVLKPNNF